MKAIPTTASPVRYTHHIQQIIDPWSNNLCSNTHNNNEKATNQCVPESDY